MDKENNNKRELMEINWEQQKVISNPLRSRMIALLYEKPMTPKQMADVLGKNPGTVYYHMQQLFKHDILEIESVVTERGTVEKLYRAKAVFFRNPEQELPKGLVDKGTTNVYLSKKLLEQFRGELQDLLYKYGHLSYEEKDLEEQSSYSVEYLIKKYEGND